MKKCLLIAWVPVFVATVSFAGAFNPKDVSADAKWMVHVDVEKYQASEIGRVIENNPHVQEYMGQVAAFRDLFNFDPQNDLHAITMYGSDEQQENAVIVVQGKFDHPRLMNIMKANPGYSESQHGSRQIITILNPIECCCAVSVASGAGDDSAADENHPMPHHKKGNNVNICFIDAGKVIIGGNIELVKKAITVCEGKGLSLEAGAVKSTSAAGCWVYMLGRGELGQMKNINPGARSLSQIDSAEIVIGEDLGNLKGKALLTARTPEMAVQMQSVVQGIVALAMINAQDAPDMAKKAQMVKAAVDGKNIEITFEFPVKDMISQIERAIEENLQPIN